MTTKQSLIINQLRANFSNATVEVVELPTGTVKVFMSIAPLSCKGDYLRNQFEVGPRGGLRVIKQEFNANY